MKLATSLFVLLCLFPLAIAIDNCEDFNAGDICEISCPPSSFYGFGVGYTYEGEILEINGPVTGYHYGQQAGCGSSGFVDIDSDETYYVCKAPTVMGSSGPSGYIRKIACVDAPDAGGPGGSGPGVGIWCEDEIGLNGGCTLDFDAGSMIPMGAFDCLSDPSYSCVLCDDGYEWSGASGNGTCVIETPPITTDCFFDNDADGAGGDFMITVEDTACPAEYVLNSDDCNDDNAYQSTDCDDLGCIVVDEDGADEVFYCCGESDGVCVEEFEVGLTGEKLGCSYLNGGSDPDCIVLPPLVTAGPDVTPTGIVTPSSGVGITCEVDTRGTATDVVATIGSCPNDYLSCSDWLAHGSLEQSMITSDTGDVKTYALPFSYNIPSSMRGRTLIVSCNATNAQGSSISLQESTTSVNELVVQTNSYLGTVGEPSGTGTESFFLDTFVNDPDGATLTHTLVEVTPAGIIDNCQIPGGDVLLCQKTDPDTSGVVTVVVNHDDGVESVDHTFTLFAYNTTANLPPSIDGDKTSSNGSFIPGSDLEIYVVISDEDAASLNVRMWVGNVSGSSVSCFYNDEIIPIGLECDIDGTVYTQSELTLYASNELMTYEDGASAPLIGAVIGVAEPTEPHFKGVVSLPSDASSGSGLLVHILATDASSQQSSLTSVVVAPEICHNGIDDNLNGYIDCTDSYCINFDPANIEAYSCEGTFQTSEYCYHNPDECEGEGVLRKYCGQATDSPNPSFCCGVGQRPHKTLFGDWVCENTDPCYNSVSPLTDDCHYDYSTEFFDWFLETPYVGDPLDWCVDNQNMRACCPVIAYGEFDYYADIDGNVELY